LVGWIELYPKRALFTGGSVGLSMNKLELPAGFMPVPRPLAGKSPIGFRIQQGPETALGSFPHFNRAGPDRVSSLRLWRCFFQPAGTEKGSAWRVHADNCLSVRLWSM